MAVTNAGSGTGANVRTNRFAGRDSENCDAGPDGDGPSRRGRKPCESDGARKAGGDRQRAAVARIDERGLAPRPPDVPIVARGGRAARLARRGHPAYATVRRAPVV